MSLYLDFQGAAGSVTGSRTLLKFNNKSFLVDAGLFQGQRQLKELNWQDPRLRLPEIEFVLLTHAHLDHSGLLPRLVKLGYKNPIYCTAGTQDLLGVLLRDAAKIQEEDAAYANRVGHSRHKPAEPLYSLEDAEQVLRQTRALPLHTWHDLAPGIHVRFHRAGHIIGSSFIEISFGVGTENKSIVFSGDLGRKHPFVLRPPETRPKCDALVLESTYGGRRHGAENPVDVLEILLKRILSRSGVALIPAFAVGRTQDILFAIREVQNRGTVPACTVILDSPMAHAATEVFLRHPDEHALDSEFKGKGNNLFPNQLRIIESADESFEASMLEGPLVVIAGSGMLSGGRMLHHMKRRLQDKKNAVIFVGYQSEGTKGHYLLHEAKQRDEFRIHHETISVEAEIYSLDVFSAHGDEDDLLWWLESGPDLPKRIFLNHGESKAQDALAKRIHTKCGIQPTCLQTPQSVVLWD